MGLFPFFRKKQPCGSTPARRIISPEHWVTPEQFSPDEGGYSCRFQAAFWSGKTQVAFICPLIPGSPTPTGARLLTLIEGTRKPFWWLYSNPSAVRSLLESDGPQAPFPVRELTVQLTAENTLLFELQIPAGRQAPDIVVQMHAPLDASPQAYRLTVQNNGTTKKL